MLSSIMFIIAVGIASLPTEASSNSTSCASNKEFDSCYSSCGQNCIDVCEGDYPDTICTDECNYGCTCSDDTYWSNNMDCCLSKLNCVIYDSQCINSSLSNNYTLNELYSSKDNGISSISDIYNLRDSSNSDTYNCSGADDDDDVKTTESKITSDDNGGNNSNDNDNNNNSTANSNGNSGNGSNTVNGDNDDDSAAVKLLADSIVIITIIFMFFGK